MTLPTKNVDTGYTELLQGDSDMAAAPEAASNNQPLTSRLTQGVKPRDVRRI